MEVVDVSLRRMRKRSLDEMEADLPVYLKRILLEHDLDAEQRLRERGNRREVKFISCRGLVRNQTLSSSEDVVSRFESGGLLADIVHVYDVADRNCEVYHDLVNEHLMITC